MEPGSCQPHGEGVGAPMQLSLATSVENEAMSVQASRSAAAALLASLLAAPNMSSTTSASSECISPQPSTTPRSEYALQARSPGLHFTSQGISFVVLPLEPLCGFIHVNTLQQALEDFASDHSEATGIVTGAQYW